MNDFQKAKTNYELAIQIISNNPTNGNASFMSLQHKIYDHIKYGKLTLLEANKKEHQKIKPNITSDEPYPQNTLLPLAV